MHSHLFIVNISDKCSPPTPPFRFPSDAIDFIISARQHFKITFPSLWKIRQNIYTVFSVHDKQSNTIYHTNLDVVIHNWRMELRESECLTTPSCERHPCGISGYPLDEDLVNFSSKCKSNFIDFKNVVSIPKQCLNRNAYAFISPLKNIYCIVNVLFIVCKLFLNFNIPQDFLCDDL